MSAVTTTPTRAIDDDRDRRPSFLRLVGVELRKMADTKAGLWLLIVIAAVTVIANVAIFAFGKQEDLTFSNLLQISGIPQGMLLPVLAILLITQEWGQRTGLATFTMTPNRSRVIVAKLVAALGLILGAFVVAVLVATVLAGVGGASDPFAGVTLGWLSGVLLTVFIGGLWGFAFGAALLSTAFAIVAYFAAPTVVSIIGGIWKGGADTIAWFDLNGAMAHLYEQSGMTGTQWAHLVTSFLIWVALPLLIGFWRIQRTEVK